jgi:hypothetical protein
MYDFDICKAKLHSTCNYVRVVKFANKKRDYIFQKRKTENTMKISL